MKRQRSFEGDTNRYAFDFTLCTIEKGWAQLDTRQDASYFGNWVNPTRRQLVGFAEGDITVTTCETDAEFVTEVDHTCLWYFDHDGQIPGIDPGFSDDLKGSFERLGLGVWLH